VVEKQPAEQVIERMVGAAFPGASYDAVQQAALAITDVGMRRAATVADALAFADRFQGRLNPQPEPGLSDPSDAPSEPAQPSERSGRRPPRVRRSLWPPIRRDQARQELRLELRALEIEENKVRNQTLLAAGQQHLDLLRQAIDDPTLTEIVATYSPNPTDILRRYLFCQALYEQEVLTYRVGVTTREELYGRMRVLLQSPYFREWWEASQYHRASQSENSEEANIGYMVDDLKRQLEETDTDEWWVAGNMPDDPDSWR